MGRRRRQGPKTPQQTYNNSIEDLVESEGNEFPVADPSRVIICVSNEFKEGLKKELKEKLVEDLKENIQKQLKSIKTTQIKKFELTDPK
jgi:hypothetical protein